MLVAPLEHSNPSRRIYSMPRTYLHMLFAGVCYLTVVCMWLGIYLELDKLAANDATISLG